MALYTQIMLCSIRDKPFNAGGTSPGQDPDTSDAFGTFFFWRLLKQLVQIAEGAFTSRGISMQSTVKSDRLPFL